MSSFEDIGQKDGELWRSSQVGIRNGQGSFAHVVDIPGWFYLKLGFGLNLFSFLLASWMGIGNTWVLDLDFALDFRVSGFQESGYLGTQVLVLTSQGLLVFSGLDMGLGIVLRDGFSPQELVPLWVAACLSLFPFFFSFPLSLEEGARYAPPPRSRIRSWQDLHRYTKIHPTPYIISDASTWLSGVPSLDLSPIQSSALQAITTPYRSEWMHLLRQSHLEQEVR